MVLVCNDPGFIYLKTRKTGSTSFEMLLEPFCAPAGHVVREQTPALISDRGIVGARLQRRGLGFVLNHRLERWRNHLSADRVRRYLGEAAWAARPRIAAVRNPFDRLLSYFFFKARYRHLHDGPFDALRAAFLEFARGPKWTDDRDIVFSRGQYCIDHAIRLEHKREDIAALARGLGIAISAEALPHTKKRKPGTKRPVAEFFDADAIATVRRRMSWVFDHFDYPDTPGDAITPEPHREVNP